ncbi:MFS transporter [Streptomyces sp. NBRC 109706]|uniref:MFS transporter n=1 Tax=Streptomyces sp. NBRC 109706 TaxID=1550035 RepID=UPI000780F82E|nr:MFS transporter [Streptomyces sp. NBRC 109706]
MNPLRPYRVVVRHGRLAYLLAGDFVSKIGDGMLLVALPLLAIRVHEPLSAALAVSLVVAAPHLISLPLGLRMGLGRTRLDPVTVIAVDCALRCSVSTALAVLAVLDALTLWPLFVMLLFGSSLRAVAGASRRVLVTGMVGKEDRLPVNSVLALNDSTALYILGPSLGGLLVLWAGPWLPLLFDGVSFVALAAGLVGLRAGRQPAARAGRRSGWQILKNTGGLWPMFCVAFGFNLLWGPISVSMPLFVQNDLHADEAAYGLLMTGLGIGAVAGSLASGFLKTLPAHRVLTVLIASWAGALCLVSFAPNVYLAAAALSVGGLVWAPFVPVMYTAVQGRLDDEDHQPVLTFWSAGYNTAGPLGVLLGAPLLALTGTRAGMVVSAGLTAALAVPALVAGRRLTAGARREAEDPPPEKAPTGRPE